MSVNVLTKDNFASEMSSGVYLVDFWAEWCGPCQMMLPILKDFAEKAPAWVKVWKVNVDNEPELAWQFGIRSIPTLMIFKDGKIVDTMVWVKKKEELQSSISKYL